MKRSKALLVLASPNIKVEGGVSSSVMVNVAAGRLPRMAPPVGLNKVRLTVSKVSIEESLMMGTLKVFGAVSPGPHDRVPTTGV